MPDSGNPPLHPTVLKALQDQLPPGSDALPFSSFMECALYAPGIGYYTRPRQRVAFDAKADFYTASSLGPVFARLLLASITDLLQEDLSPCTFVELGPESEHGVMGNLPGPPPFKEIRLLRRQDPLNLPTPAIVFANEILDAQPFRRFVFSQGAWQELFVRPLSDGPEAVLRPPASPPPELPAHAPEGYTVDWPSGAIDLLHNICKGEWTGLFLTLDYGMSMETALHERPQGTGRAYHQHSVDDDLLRNPGERDLTCHLLWEPLTEVLEDNGFSRIQLLSQEAFFMHHGQSVLKEIIEGSGPGLSRDKQTLMELLHPHNMGHKFHALMGAREAAPLQPSAGSRIVT